MCIYCDYWWKPWHRARLCREFARQGLNLLLIARTLKSNGPAKGETLMDLKEELTNKYGVDVRIHQADISMNDGHVG